MNAQIEGSLKTTEARVGSADMLRDSIAAGAADFCGRLIPIRDFDYMFIEELGPCVGRIS